MIHMRGCVTVAAPFRQPDIPMEKTVRRLGVLRSVGSVFDAPYAFGW